MINVNHFYASLKVNRLKLITKQILITIAITFIVGCKSENKNGINELKSKKSIAPNKMEVVKSDTILDTLIFDQNMNGDYLDNKYSMGLNELNFYKDFISINEINKKQVLTTNNSKTEIRYLGKLKDLENSNTYHVITNFKIIGVGEMLSPRGQSYVAFLDNDFKNLIIYRMALPDELPEKIHNNILYFTVESNIVGISISGGLPPEFCVPKIGCN